MRRDSQAFIEATVKSFCLVATFTLLLFVVWPSQANAAVLRDRTVFNGVSQNLHTIDFESVVPLDFELNHQVDGVFFESIGGMGIGSVNGSRMLTGSTVGEITRLTVFLPPGTTAVGCDQFGSPMIVSSSTGDSVTMNQSDPSTFVGFLSDQPIQSVTFFFDFPEPTPNAVIDNLSFGQKRTGNEPPVPQLLLSSLTGRAIALDSVTKESDPFLVISSRNLSTDNRTRVTLFVVGVLLGPSDLPFVSVKAEDAQQRVFDLPCEATGRVKNLAWMSQVTVRLPESLIGIGDLNVSVTVRGLVSNKASFRVD